MKTRVVVADDSPAYLELLTVLLAHVPELEVVGAVSDGWEAVRAAVEKGADVALLDVEMPGLDGFAAAEEIRRLRPQTELLLHTGGMVQDRRRGELLNLGVLDKLDLMRTVDLLTKYGERRAAKGAGTAAPKDLM